MLLVHHTTHQLHTHTFNDDNEVAGFCMIMKLLHIFLTITKKKGKKQVQQTEISPGFADAAQKHYYSTYYKQKQNQVEIIYFRCVFSFFLNRERQTTAPAAY